MSVRAHRAPRGVLLRLCRDAPLLLLGVAILGFVVLPALHLLVHQREARLYTRAYLHFGLRAERSQSGERAMLRAPSGSAYGHAHGALHTHQPPSGGRRSDAPQHGKGTLEHLSAALLGAAAFILPERSGSVEYAPSIVPRLLCPSPPAFRPNSIRGPPPVC